MISVCMASFNGEKYIEEQIQSILCQLGENDELIISDDLSTDRTVSIIQSIDDDRIRLIMNPTNHGYTGNFYNALKYARGDYIFLSDQDDVWYNNKIEKTVKYFNDYNFIVSDAKEVDSNLLVIAESRIKKYGIKKGFWPNLVRCRYIGCCMAFDRTVLNAIYPVPTYANDYPHDLWIALIGEGYFNSYLIDEPLILYRRHMENASNGGVAEKNTLGLSIKRVFRRFYYLYFFIKQFNHINKIKKELL